MEVVTRLNPTCSGPIHLGHVYMGLLNEHVAKSAGGKFYIRLEDNHPLITERLGDRQERIKTQQIEDFKWLEFEIEDFIFHSTTADSVSRRVKDSIGVLWMEDPIIVPVFSTTTILPFPSVPKLTAEKVLMDYDMGVTHLIRGIDLATEYCLYAYFCVLLGVPEPKHYYTPRLADSTGDVSKTGGAISVAHYRRMGYTPGDIKEIVSKASLWNPLNGWEIDNLKRDPCL